MSSCSFKINFFRGDGSSSLKLSGRRLAAVSGHFEVVAAVHVAVDGDDELPEEEGVGVFCQLRKQSHILSKALLMLGLNLLFVQESFQSKNVSSFNFDKFGS